LTQTAPTSDIISIVLDNEELSSSGSPVASGLKCGLESLFDGFVDSFAAFFQFPRSESNIDTIERIVSIPILGVAFLALRRKFERK
jgi:hypothetical protein